MDQARVTSGAQRRSFCFIINNVGLCLHNSSLGESYAQAKPVLMTHGKKTNFGGLVTCFGKIMQFYLHIIFLLIVYNNKYWGTFLQQN